MGKPTGFLEYLRELPLDRSALERIKDWNEFHTHLPETGLRAQAARCMDCGTPFCHTGILISGIVLTSHGGQSISLPIVGTVRAGHLQPAIEDIQCPCLRRNAGRPS